MNAETVNAAALVMKAAADAYNAAHNAGADEETLKTLRGAHSVARCQWTRARAAAGDVEARVLVVIGAA